LRVVNLPGTGITTSALGFGCAGLFRLPRRSDRRDVLQAACEAGIRHFDVAPMYGLGLAEAELAPILERRREDFTVTTKFGIDPTSLGRVAARIQPPVRGLLARLPSLGDELKVVGAGPGSGWIGRLLYVSEGYSAHSAEVSLIRSLRALRTSYVDVFCLHDPTGDLVSGTPDLVAYLNEQCAAGRIRSWGVTGDSQDQFSGTVRQLSDAAGVVQFRDDIFDARPHATPGQAKAGITFGALARALPVLQRFLAEHPAECSSWSDRLGRDLGDRASLPTLLLREALRRNVTGPVLFTSTRPARVYSAANAAAEDGSGPGIPDGDEATAMMELAAAVKSSNPSLGRSDD
jgi:D-threo-aldose 1-dehydrogenase